MSRFLARFRCGAEPEWFGATPLCFGPYRIAFRGFIADAGPLGTAPAADVFARAYERWGDRLCEHVTGEYAVLIHDTAARRVLLARDELGLMPLFYSHSPGQEELVVASDLEDLVAMTGPGELDEGYLTTYLAEGWHFGEGTPFTHCRRVLPGQTVIWSEARLRQRKTSTLESVAEAPLGSHGEYEERLRDLIFTAVRAAGQRSEGKVWCELSGGLDSSTVLAAAARQGIGPLEAISFVYSRSKLADETPWIKSVLDVFPVPWRTLDADEVCPFTEFPRQFFAEPNLALIHAAFRRRYVQMLAENGVSRLLTGMGGDAVLLGNKPSPYFLADLLRSLRIRTLFAEARRWADASEAQRPVGYWLYRSALKPLWARQSKPSAAERQSLAWASPGFWEELARHRRNGNESTAPFASTPRTAAARMLDDIKRNALMVATYQRHRDLPCDTRHPLLAVPVVRFMLSVPWRIKLHPSYDRLLHRRAFEALLPSKIILRRSKLGPDETFFRGLSNTLEWRQRLTETPVLVERGYIVKEAWQLAVEQACQGRVPGMHSFLATANLEVWLQEFRGWKGKGSVGRPIEPARAVAGF